MQQQKPSLSCSPLSRKRGMSPVDLVAYMASGLLVGFGALPSFGLFDAHELNQASPDATLPSHLEYARREAVQQKRTITVCPSINGQHCADHPAWAQGWLIFTDTKGVRGQQNPGDELVYAHVPDPGQMVLGINARYVSYLPDGAVVVE